jgi:hypothetical protein
MLELGARGDVLPVGADEPITLELVALDDDREEGVIREIDAVVGIDEVVVRLDAGRVVVSVVTDGLVVTAVLIELEEGTSNDVVNPLLWLRLERLEVTDAELLEGMEREELDVALITVVEIVVTVAVCPPERVLVRVVQMLDAVGGTGVDGIGVGDGLITVTDVLVSVVVDPPGIVLMSVAIVLDVSGEIDVDVDLVVNIEVLALAADDPPGVLLVDDERPLGVGSAVEPVELKDPPTTVVEIVVKVVVCPPDIVLISVTGMVEVVGVSELPIVREVTPPMVVEVTLVRVEGWLIDIAVVVVAELGTMV